MSDLKDRIYKANQDQLEQIPAQRLIEKLLPLQSRVKQTARRWFWELLQNASDYNEVVDVKLGITENKVDFTHNGKPFSLEDVLNIISPNSNKRKRKEASSNIGRFGSGLVSTHILSPKLAVGGIWYDAEGYNRFNIDLDRSTFGDKQKLVDSIKLTKEQLTANSIPYAGSLQGFNTIFSYDLTQHFTEFSNGGVIALGIDYIYDVLPITLCFMSKVQSIEIEDNRIEAKVKKYMLRRESESPSEIVLSETSNQNNTKIKFYQFEHDNAQTVLKQADNSLVDYPKEIAKIFCGLPMIGSEKTGLPIVLNSFAFDPTVEREGVNISPNDKVNRKVFDSAIHLYADILKFVENKKIGNAHLIALLRDAYDGVEESKIAFRRDFLPQLVQKLKAAKIAANVQGEPISVGELRLPFHEGKQSEPLYDCAMELLPKKLPNKETYSGWFDAIDFGLLPELKYDVISFLGDVTKTTRIEGFVLYSEKDAKKWLKGVVSFVSSIDEIHFSKHAILPNQKGELHKKEALCFDDAIPKELKVIYNKLHTAEIENSLLDSSFLDFKHLLQNTRDVSWICKQIDDALKNKYSEDKGSTNTFIEPLKELYKWWDNSKKTKEELKDLFPWFYSKRAVLFMDTFNEVEREHAFAIAQSGKIEALAKLAGSVLTEAELSLVAENASKFREFLKMISDKVDAVEYVDPEVGQIGEQLVYEDLKKRYTKPMGYEVIWSSKEGEPRFDFEVKKGSQTILYVDAKTTRRGIANGDTIPFYMRISQWGFIPENVEGARYLIARVFLSPTPTIKYLRLHLDLVTK